MRYSDGTSEKVVFIWAKPPVISSRDCLPTGRIRIAAAFPHAETSACCGSELVAADAVQRQLERTSRARQDPRRSWWHLCVPLDRSSRLVIVATDCASFPTFPLVFRSTPRIGSADFWLYSQADSRRGFEVTCVDAPGTLARVTHLIHGPPVTGLSRRYVGLRLRFGGERRMGPNARVGVRTRRAATGSVAPGCLIGLAGGYARDQAWLDPPVQSHS
jgi:hypothetical protein